MIAPAEIQRWREHAPWASDVQVEQDFLLSRIIGAIFADPYLHRNLAMRGGTVLHKVHLAPASRYSEDIDLVLVGHAPIKNVVIRLRHVLAWLGQPQQDLAAKWKLTVRNLTQPSKIARLTYLFAPASAPPRQAKIKIEINYSENVPVYGTVERTLPVPSADGESIENARVRSYDIDEMLGTKMRALLQRTQGRDLFDLSHAWNCHLTDSATGIDPDRVVQAFYHYMDAEGVAIHRSDYETNLTEKVRTSSFRTDMNQLLRPGMNYDVDAASEIVREVFLSRLRQNAHLTH